DESIVAVAGMAEGDHGRFHALDVAVVIGAEKVDGPVRAPEFAEVMKGDIHPEVGQLAVRLAQHAVLVVPEGGGAEPEGTVLLIAVPGRGELRDDPLWQPARSYI